MSEERVLVFPETLLNDIGLFDGATRDVDKYVSKILQPEALSWLDRSKAETDPSFKQVIPYTIIQSNKIGVGQQYFVYQRTKKGGETRLHNLLSLGVGGHINPQDGDVFAERGMFGISFKDALWREINEEIEMHGEHTLRCIGLLYDDSNDVGKVHFGIVNKISLASSGWVKTKADALANGEFRDRLWLEDNYDNFENWSKLVIRKLL